MNASACTFCCSETPSCRRSPWCSRRICTPSSPLPGTGRSADRRGTSCCSNVSRTPATCRRYLRTLALAAACTRPRIASSRTDNIGSSPKGNCRNRPASGTCFRKRARCTSTICCRLSRTSTYPRNTCLPSNCSCSGISAIPLPRKADIRPRDTNYRNCASRTCISCYIRFRSSNL